MSGLLRTPAIPWDERLRQPRIQFFSSRAATCGRDLCSTRRRSSTDARTRDAASPNATNTGNSTGRELQRNSGRNDGDAKETQLNELDSELNANATHQNTHSSDN